jgi:beta-lactam-binding protein with PASTA domain
VGKVTEEVHEEDTTKPGTVTGHKPEPGTSIAIDGAVDITVATKNEH